MGALKIVKVRDELPKLTDFAEYRNASAKLSELAAQFNAATLDLQRAEDSLARLRSVRGKSLRDNALALLEGKPTALIPTIDAQREEIRARHAVLAEAVIEQKQIVDEIAARCSVEIIVAATPRHRQLVEKIVELAEALADAVDAEAELRRGVIAGGVSPNAIWPQISTFANRIGSRQQYGSPVNALARGVAEYLGRAWSATKVTR